MDLFMGLFIETGYSEEIAQWNYLNMTAGVEDYSSGGGGRGDGSSIDSFSCRDHCVWNIYLLFKTSSAEESWMSLDSV